MAPFFGVNGEHCVFSRNGELCRLTLADRTVERLGVSAGGDFAIDAGETMVVLTAGSAFASAGVTRVDLASRASRTVVKLTGRWSPMPSFAGNEIIYTAVASGGCAQVYCVHHRTARARAPSPRSTTRPRAGSSRPTGDTLAFPARRSAPGSASSGALRSASAIVVALWRGRRACDRVRCALVRLCVASGTRRDELCVRHPGDSPAPSISA
jgi:hypothetical protein